MHSDPPALRSRVAWPAEVPTPARADDEPLVLPEAPPPARRTQLPILASIAPVLGAVALWLVTGSAAALWFALLGPLIAVATLLDGRRAARRDRRRAIHDAADARARVSAEIERRHARERARRWADAPDVAVLAQDGTRVWRTSAGPDLIVVGRGEVASALRVAGGTGDDESRAVRASAATLDRAPLTVPLSRGIAVTGPPVIAAAVARALAMQACLLHPPGALRLVGAASGEQSWSADLPHRRAETGITLALVAPGDAVPAAEAVIVRVDPGAAPPPRCGAILTVTGLGRGRLLADGVTTDVDTEALGTCQAAQLAVDLAARARSAFPAPAERPPVRLVALTAGAPAARSGALTAVIGVDDDGPVTIDLVGDGPHAVVAGVTGAGKSELLITWVTALCATHSTHQVTFLLADFKGGTAFDALRALPHVTGVLTDLDGTGARRALESLRAEVRRREEHLARAGARDVLDERAELPRLVIVVDEFAALLSDHPELQQVFTDVAARGRALGMHLILGTQRAAGVVRDALLANCPLRISLRVTDPADSRAVIGTDEAARLPGGASSRGEALLRRAADVKPQSVRIALTETDDIGAAAERVSAEPAPWRPWLPELPSRAGLDALLTDARPPEGALVLGLVDEPARQSQHVALLTPTERGLAVIGMAGSGRSTALAAIAKQVPDRLLRWIPSDPERAWDAIERLEHPLPEGAVVIVDDVDALIARYGLDHAHVMADRIERVARMAGDAGIRIVVSAQRLTGAAGRIADLLPRRALLAMPSRSDVVAAGGDGASWTLGTPPGRAILDGKAMQFAWAGSAPAPGFVDAAPEWWPGVGVSGVVARRGAASRLSQALRSRGADVVGVDDAIALVESPRPFDAPVAVVGDPDAWQRAWRVLGAVRAEHELAIDAACAADYRALTGDREPPPYCAPRHGRAWLLTPGDAPRRVQLPADDTDGRDGGGWQGESP